MSGAYGVGSLRRTFRDVDCLRRWRAAGTSELVHLRYMKTATIWVLAISLLAITACGDDTSGGDSASAKTPETETQGTSPEEMKVDTAEGLSKEQEELLEVLPVIL